MTNKHNTIESALAGGGLVLTGSIVADGTLQRTGTARKPRGKNGWYIAYDDGAAIYGNWEEGDGYQYWHPKGDKPTATARDRIEKIKEERAKQHSLKADEALEYYEGLPREGYNDYLKRKRIYPHGARFDEGAIVIPVQDAQGRVWSYQRIYGDGAKYFMPGGRVSGCYHFLAKGNVSKDELVVVCEGFATGATIHQCTGLPVVVAFNAGNLKPVADSLPFRNLLIAADNDASQVGEQSARESGYKYVMPDVEGWDFSDVFLERGEEAVRGYFTTPASATHAAISVHGLVATIADWITATAVRPQPMLSLAASLAFVATLKGHRIAGGTDLRTNLLILSLAPTAAGKEHPQNAIKRLVSASGLDKHLMGEPVSGGGFLTGLLKSQRVGLLVMDEMGRYLANLSHRTSGTYQREIVDYIIKTFSSANSVLKGRQYVDEKKNPTIDIEQPHFCCLGSTVPERMQAACGSSEVIDGFLNRWLVFDVPERVKRADSPPAKADVPAQIVSDVQSYLASHPTVYNQYGQSEPPVAKFTPEAWDVFKRYRDRMDDAVDRASYPVDRLYGRAPEHVEKIALVLCDDEDILVGDVRSAIAIVEHSNRAILQFAGLIADNVYEQDFIRVREIVKKAGEIKRSQLTYRCQFVQGGARRIQEIAQALVDENLVAQRKVGNLTTYKWIG